MTDAFIIDAVRTPMGKNGGQLADVRGDQLLAECLQALEERNGFDPRHVEDVVGGCVTQTQEQGALVIQLPLDSLTGKTTMVTVGIYDGDQLLDELETRFTGPENTREGKHD